MYRVIKNEAKRFFKVWAICITIYVLYALLFLKINSEQMVIYENIQISIFVLGINIYILINLILDNFTHRNTLYYHASLSKLNILLGKLLTLFLYNMISILICATVYNIRLLILAQNRYLVFFRMNLDNVGFALIEKSFRECLYPINFLLNLIYYDILIYATVIFNHALRKKYHTLIALICASSIVFVHIIIYYLVKTINAWSRTLDFNVIYNRTNVITFNQLELNFLSLFFLIVFGFISVILLIKISGYQEENHL